MSFGISENISGVDVAFGLGWSPKKTKCGVEVTTLQGKQFGAAGDNLVGHVSFAGYVSSKIDSGIVLYQLANDKWCIVGLISGVLAPESDSIIDNEDILDAIGDMSNLVPDNIYIAGEGDLDIQYEPLDISDIKGSNTVVTKEKFDIKKIVAVLLLFLAVGGFFGYKQYQKQVKAEEMRQAQIEAERARIVAEKLLEKRIYESFYLLAPSLYADVIPKIESIVPSKIANWKLQSFKFPSMEASYKRTSKGNLRNIYDYVKSNELGIKELDETGNSVAIDFGLVVTGSYPFLNTDDLLSPNETWVNVVTAMQTLNHMGFATGVSRVAPVWAGILPNLASKYEMVFFKVEGENRKIADLLNSVNIFGSVVGEIVYDYNAAKFSAEFAVYSKK